MDNEEAKGRENQHYNNWSNYFTGKTLVQTESKVGKNFVF